MTTAPVPNQPMVNLGNLYRNGCQMAYVGNSSLTVAAGQVRESQNVNDITLAAQVTLSAAVNGVVNGLDTGSLGASTLYAVYAIGDSTGFQPSGSLLSLSFSVPQLPYGYDMFRRIGAVLTDGSSHILDFTQRGNSMWYAASIATPITAGAATTFTFVDCSAIVPTTAIDIVLLAVLTADAGATRTAALAAYGSSSAAGQTVMSSPASTVTSASLRCPSGLNASSKMGVDYLVSNASAAIALNVFGYTDAL